jgi:hypothetical protein
VTARLDPRCNATNAKMVATKRTARDRAARAA